MKKIDWATILNYGTTILLILLIAMAVQQRYFEEKKCMKWSEDRIYNIRTGNSDLSYTCSMECNSSYGESFVADSNSQHNYGIINYTETNNE